jgi:hypothetical protein
MLLFANMPGKGIVAVCFTHQLQPEYEFATDRLDMSNVKHQKGIEQELSRWARVLANERLDLLEKIAFEMAKAKGAKLPSKLRVVMRARRHVCTATK